MNSPTLPKAEQVIAKTVALATPEQMRQRIRDKSKLKGRQVDDAAWAEVIALIGSKPLRRDLLIEYLHQLNDRYRGLRELHLVALAKLMKLSMAEVFEVASFYHHFDILPVDEQGGELTVRVCDGLSCELAGAQNLLKRLPSILGTESLRVIAAPCVGRCEQAPVVVVHQNPVSFASVEAVKEHVQTRAILAPAILQHMNYAQYVSQGGYALLRKIQDGELLPDILIQSMEDSGLRGLGGAGFPAGKKWRIVRDQPAPRLMAVNIDEGEPGTFKDRSYLESDPHRFLEGMLIAAKVVGVDAIYIYLRDEYHACRAMLEAELALLREHSAFVLPRIELRRGAGAYICGEESAMIESIEGKRGEPRMRPPYIAQVGLFGRPTLEHNFETLFWVRELIERGPAWLSGQGRHGRKGLRSFSVSGRVQQPGVKLAPAGITLSELIEEYCGGMLAGHQLYAYLPGGASGGILPASLANIPLDFDTLQPYGCFIGSAAVIVLSDQDRARDAALNMMRFFADESCGQCTPCRVGTVKASALMQVAVWDRATLESLNQVMADASICGLGQAAPNPIRSVLKYFAHEVQAHA